MSFNNLVMRVIILRARRGYCNGGIPLDLIGQLIGSSLIRPRGEVEADRHRCNLCGKCQMICRRHAIFIDRKRRIWTLYPNRCNLCLECVSRCSNDALKIVK